MKRAITSIAAATVVLGSVIPMAFADTTPSYLNAGTKPFVVNGTTLSNPYVLDSTDSGNVTAFIPVYYFDAALAKFGITAAWNGSTKTWALTSSSLTAAQVTAIAAAVPGGVGSGNTTITLNGTTIKMINTFAAQDPAGVKGDITTYFPAYYVNNIFTAAGITASWNGTTGLSVGTGTTTTASAALSTIAATGATVGTGSVTAPAINTTGGAVTLSTKLTDANGNPIANSNLTVQFVGTVAATPTVEQGTTFATVSPVTGDTDTYSATVTTDSTGTATFAVTGVGAYTVTVTAPYGSSTTQTAYIGFSSNAALITPGSNANAYSATISTLSNATTGVVPVTVTLPLNSSGDVQSDTAVAFTLTNGTHAFFSNAQGAQVGTGSFTAYTNSNGQATVYVNDYTAENVLVNANSGQAETTIDYSTPSTAAAPLSAIGAYAFAPANTLTSAASTSVSGIPAGTEAYFAPFNSSEELQSTTQGSNGNETYTLTASNGGVISSINGVSLSGLAGGALGTPSTVQLGVSYDSTGYLYTVNGVQLTGVDNANGYFSVGVSAGSSATGSSSVLTVSSGSTKATATYNYTDNAEYVTNFSPVYGTLSTPGSAQNVTFTVVDANGNPVANSSAVVQYDNTLSNVWVTSVNGAPLSQNFGSGSEPTPVPLFNAASLATAPAYDSGLSLPGVVSWTNSSASTNGITVTTNAQGQVTLTLQAGDVTYYDGASTGSTVYSSGGTLTPATVYGYTYSGNTSNTNQLYIGTNPATGYTKVGQISW